MSVNSDSLIFLNRPKFLRERPVMVILDNPLDQEIKNKSAYSAPSSSTLFSEFNRLGLLRGYIHATYLFSFRPEKGDISALFHRTGLPLSEYVHWPDSKNDHIVNYAYTELLTLKEEIQAIKPALIICAGRWALYFLTGETSFNETKKSPFGTLLKWRASALQLTKTWEYNQEHIVVPIIPPSVYWQLPDKQVIVRQDYKRIANIGTSIINNPESVRDYARATENFIIKPTFQQVKSFLFGILQKLYDTSVSELLRFSVDIETRDGYIDCFSIATSPTDAICIPFSTTTTPHYWAEAEELEIISLMHELFMHPDFNHIGQNYSYDMQYFFHNLALTVTPFQDTMVMQHTLFPGMEKDLAFLSSLYCRVHRYWKDEGATHKGRSDEERWVYNCRDTCKTYEIANVLADMYRASPKNIQEAYNFQLNELVPGLVEIMNRGVRYKDHEKEKLYSELKALMREIEIEFTYALDTGINLNSVPQKKELFYDFFGLPVQKDPKTHEPTLNAEALEILAQHEPLARPFLDRVAEYGNLKTFSSTFLSAKCDPDGRMRTSYNACGTDTFRLASRKNAFDRGMNLQNVPSGGETATGRKLPNIRNLFIPDPGYIFFDIDLDSADLRVVVAESGAKDLQAMLDAGLKPYIEMMKEYYNDPTKNKNSPEYKTFKSFAHGTNYLGSASGLAVRLGLLVHEVDKLQKWYFGRNPEIKKWHEDLRKQVFGRGWIENVFGYRRYFFNKEEKTIMQIAAAWKPQSTVGTLINHGLVNIRHNEPQIQVLLQVHDSLAGQFPEWMEDGQERIITQCSVPLPYEVPIVIPVGINVSKESWGGCKE